MNDWEADAGEFVIVRVVTVIDEDGDAAWRVQAVSTTSHTLDQLMADWPRLVNVSDGEFDGVGVASPLLFIALGQRDWCQVRWRRLREAVAGLIDRLKREATDPLDELAAVNRVLTRRGQRFDEEVWTALCLQHLVVQAFGGSLAQVTGEIDERFVVAAYLIEPETDPDDAAELTAAAVQAWASLLPG